ncbi:MAG: LysR family transcriptional regulator for bpeEF and oprC [Hyphomicrobiaceae bacterium]|jgi:LysR family transcriptional regulator for bpeEF and oprC
MAQIDSKRVIATATLIQVIETGSMTAAAKRIGCTPSSVSKQMSGLEDALGVRLLERTTRRVSPTPAGQALYERSRPLFEGLEQAEAAATQLNTTIRGRVRISASPAFGRACLAPVLATLLGEHPQLNFEVVLTSRRLDFVEDSIDLAIREGRLQSSGLIARNLGTATVGLAASKKYFSKRKRPRQVGDLAHHDLLLVPSAEATFAKLNIRDAKGQRVRLRPRVVMDDLFAIAELAETGAGIAALPDYVLEHSRLETVLPRLDLGKLPIHAVYPSRRHLPRRVEVVLEALTENLVA